MNKNNIAKDFRHGKKFQIGKHCVIQENCSVGYKVDIQHFVLLKKGTKIGDFCYIDSFVRSSGQNTIGSNVTLRFGSTIAREVTIEDNVFISPNVMTIYSDHHRVKKGGIVIGKHSFIGTNVVIAAGVKIAPNCVVGAMSLVTKDLRKAGIYMGIPAKWVKAHD